MIVTLRPMEPTSLGRIKACARTPDYRLYKNKLAIIFIDFQKIKLLLFQLICSTKQMKSARNKCSFATSIFYN